MNKLWIGNGTSQNAPEKKRKKHLQTNHQFVRFHGITFGVYNLDFSHGFQTLSFGPTIGKPGLAFIGLGGFYRSGPRRSEGRWATGCWVVLEKMPGVMEMSCSCLQFCNGIKYLFLVCFEENYFVLLLCSCTFLTLSRWSFLGGWYYIDHCNGRCWSINSSRLTRTSIITQNDVQKGSIPLL